MKVIAVCDAGGAVLGLATVPSGGLRPSFKNLPEGQREIELEVPGLADGKDDLAIQRQLADLKKRFSVDLEQARLVPRHSA